MSAREPAPKAMTTLRQMAPTSLKKLTENWCSRKRRHMNAKNLHSSIDMMISQGLLAPVFDNGCRQVPTHGMARMYMTGIRRMHANQVTTVPAHGL